MITPPKYLALQRENDAKHGESVREARFKKLALLTARRKEFERKKREAQAATVYIPDTGSIVTYFGVQGIGQIL